MKHDLVVVVHTQKKSKTKLSKERWEECIEGRAQDERYSKQGKEALEGTKGKIMWKKQRRTQ